MKVALFSGGKDSHYAIMREWPVDLLLFLVYEFPEPSPHIENLRAAAEAAACLGRPMVVFKVPPREPDRATASLLSTLGADVLVAGDVYIEDHLRYMERVASLAGASLREPLWGEDPQELLYKIVESGVEALIVGARGGARGLVGRLLSRATVDSLVEELRRAGADPLGERGEYHTLVVASPLYTGRLGVREAYRLEKGGVVVSVVAVERSCTPKPFKG